MNHFDIEKVRSEIIALIAANPELAEDEILREDMLDGCTDLDELKERLGFQMIVIKGQRVATQFYIDHYEKKDAAYERGEEALKAIAGRLQDAAGLPRLKTVSGTFYTTTQNPKPVVLNEDALPEECFSVERWPSMTKIKEWIKANNGQLPAGVAMSNGGRSIAFRR